MKININDEIEHLEKEKLEVNKKIDEYQKKAYSFQQDLLERARKKNDLRKISKLAKVYGIDTTGFSAYTKNKSLMVKPSIQFILNVADTEEELASIIKELGSLAVERRSQNINKVPNKTADERLKELHQSYLDRLKQKYQVATNGELAKKIGVDTISISKFSTAVYVSLTEGAKVILDVAETDQELISIIKELGSLVVGIREARYCKHILGTRLYHTRVRMDKS